MVVGLVGHAATMRARGVSVRSGMSICYSRSTWFKTDVIIQNQVS